MGVNKGRRVEEYSFDRMNMTKKFVHDQKHHTDKHLRLEHDQKFTTMTNNNG